MLVFDKIQNSHENYIFEKPWKNVCKIMCHVLIFVKNNKK